MTYTVVMLREKDGRYSAIVPALPGCATWGESLPEALKMVEEAILAYRDGQEALGLPMPADVGTVNFDLGEAAEASVYRVTVAEEAVFA
ncbi:type II toxin-antitoxin system HicB family antitoxin [bacterium]|nr:type II toxin-antitoxin system HicB family antitoxin [bacterium]